MKSTRNIQVKQELASWAATLPRMSSSAVGPFLTELAQRTEIGDVVEIGSWLGYGSAHLALGLSSRRKVHVYDAFECRGLEAEKAIKFGVKILPGQDTLPVVQVLLEPVLRNVCFHKGDIRTAGRRKGPISLLVDDASKQEKLFSSTMHTFGPSLRDGALIALLDFNYFMTSGDSRHEFQKEVVSRYRSHFDRIPHPMGNTPELFRYRVGNGRFRDVCEEKRGFLD